MWSHDFSCKYFLVCNFLLETSTSTQTTKVKFGHDKFGEKAMYNVKPRKTFLKKSRDQVDKVINQFHLSMRISAVSFDFILHMVRKHVNSL